MAKLKSGCTVLTVDGEEVSVQDVLGEGGQGIVYKVLFRGKPHALKWYSRGVGEKPERFWRNVAENVRRGSPAPTFLWPLALTNMDADGCFGYVMPLRPAEYKDFDLFLLNRVQFRSFGAVVNAAMQITASFKKLHNLGLSYQDLNDGNFFINPDTGDVLICDNDNVAAHGTNLGIQGKPKYMAPEVVTLSTMPDTYSDRFSLAVILFLLLFHAHPLMGRRDNPRTDPAKNEMSLYCTHPVFIFDLQDESNRPEQEIHKNALLFWNLYPSGIRLLFIRAFSKPLMGNDGGGERQNRIMEKEWLGELARLRTQIVTCPSCGEETFFEAEDEEHKCINCGKAFTLPPLLVLPRFKVPLQPGRTLRRYEVEDIDLDISVLGEAWGEVIQNKKNPSIWGFRNLSPKQWHKITPAGKDEICEPNGVVPVARGIKIDFATGKTIGTIQ